MDLSQDASDWQVCLIGCIGYGMIVAAGAYFMDFYSASLDTSSAVRFRFYGAGFGVGGNLSGFALPNLVPDVWTTVPCKHAFAAWDLDGASGAIGNAGVGVGAQIGVTNMKANNGSDVLFDFDGDLGLSGGFGAGVSGLMGTYGLKGIVANVPSSEWAA